MDSRESPSRTVWVCVGYEITIICPGTSCEDRSNSFSRIILSVVTPNIFAIESIVSPGFTIYISIRPLKYIFTYINYMYRKGVC